MGRFDKIIKSRSSYVKVVFIKIKVCELKSFSLIHEMLKSFPPNRGLIKFIMQSYFSQTMKC